MSLRDLFGLEKMFSTKNLYISRVQFLGDEIKLTRRHIFRGPFIKDGVKYYQIFPSMEPFYVYDSTTSSIRFCDFMRFNELFPDLKKVTFSQIVNISESLYEKDLISDVKLGDFDYSLIKR